MTVLGKGANRLAISLGIRLEQVRSAVASATLPRFANKPAGLVIHLPRELANTDRIHVGNDVKIGANSVLKASVRFPGSWLRHPDGRHVEQEFSPTLIIGDRVTATSALQVVCFDRIEIQDDVMFASNVYVSDGTHGISSGKVPYKYQGIERVAPITIGRGSWIGQNVVIMPGVTIGENAVVGANSVVTRDVPGHSIALGSPARVIRQWDDSSAAWRPTSENGGETASI